MLGSADVVISVLEPDAGSFSVPSKVLSYLCAGRAIVLSAPSTNLASRIIVAEGAGAVVPPGDAERFAEGVVSLLGDPDRRASCAAAARRYAERAFSIGPIADRFESVFLEDGVRPS